MGAWTDCGLRRCPQIGYKWLALEREAASYRGVEAADAAVGALRHALLEHLGAVAATVARTLDDEILTRPPFRAPAAIPAILSAAYLFDGSGTLLAPDYVARPQPNGNVQAATLLALAREALAAGKEFEAERQSVEIAECCPAARDEYGVAFVWYAAWQRAAIYQRQADGSTKGDALVHELRTLVERGYLGTAHDISVSTC